MAASARSVRAGSAFVEAFLDDTPFVRGLRVLANKSRKIAESLQIGGLFAGAAGAGIVLPFMKFVKVASEFQELANRFQATFRGLSGEADKWANEWADAANRSVNAVRESLSTFQSITLGFGFDPRQSMELSKFLTTMQSDISSFYEIPESIARQKLLSGLAGEIEPLRRIGIPINEATVAMKLLSFGFKGNVKAATEAQKAIARAAIIAETMGKDVINATGDVIRTLTSPSNLFRGFIAQVRELSASVGAAVTTMASTWIPFFTNVVREGKAWVDANKEIVKSVFKVGVGLLIAAKAMLVMSIGFRLLSFGINRILGPLDFFFRTIGKMIQPFRRLATAIFRTTVSIIKMAIAITTKALVAVTQLTIAMVVLAAKGLVNTAMFFWNIAAAAASAATQLLVFLTAGLAISAVGISLTTVMGALAVPLLVLSAALTLAISVFASIPIAALAAARAIGGMLPSMDQLRSGISGVFVVFKNVFSNIKGTISSLIPVVRKTIDGILWSFREFIAKLKPAISLIVAMWKNDIKELIYVFMGVKRAIMDAIAGRNSRLAFEILATFAKYAFKHIVGTIIGTAAILFKELIPLISAIINAVASLVGNSRNQLLNLIDDVILQFQLGWIDAVLHVTNSVDAFITKVLGIKDAIVEVIDEMAFFARMSAKLGMAAFAPGVMLFLDTFKAGLGSIGNILGPGNQPTVEDPKTQREIDADERKSDRGRKAHSDKEAAKGRNEDRRNERDAAGNAPLVDTGFLDDLHEGLEDLVDDFEAGADVDKKALLNLILQARRAREEEDARLKKLRDEKLADQMNPMNWQKLFDETTGVGADPKEKSRVFGTSSGREALELSGRMAAGNDVARNTKVTADAVVEINNRAEQQAAEEEVSAPIPPGQPNMPWATARQRHARSFLDLDGVPVI